MKKEIICRVVSGIFCGLLVRFSGGGEALGLATALIIASTADFKPSLKIYMGLRDITKKEKEELVQSVCAELKKRGVKR